MRRVAVAVAALAAALLIQLTIVNGLVLPGGGTPDLVLLCVIALALVGGRRGGLIAGFGAGLAIDLAPPASQLLGQYALVFCLVGYCCGRLRFTLRRSAALALAVAAMAAAVGEALAAGITLALDSPDVTWATVVQLLPSSVLYDVVLSPLVLFVVVRVALALGAGVGEPAGSPALELGGSAGPAGAAGEGAARRVGLAGAGRVGLAVCGSLRPAGDVAAAGAVGWLSGPAKSRQARRAQDRRIALLTGAAQRKGDVWVGSRPAGVRPADPVPAGRKTGPVRLNPGAGVAGSAAAVSRPAARVVPQRPVRLGLADQQRRSRRARSGGLIRSGADRSGAGRPDRDGHGVDRHGLFGSGVRRISFGSGNPVGAGRLSPGRLSPVRLGPGWLGPGRLSPGRLGPGRLGPGRLGPGRLSPGRPGVPRISFAGGSELVGAGRVSRSRPGIPSIAFGGGSLRRAGRMSPGRPAAPRFRSESSSSVRNPAARSRPRKTARFGIGRSSVLHLPGLRRAGGRSTVWRIGSTRTKGYS